MGLFSSKTKTYVSVASVVYNMLGDTKYEDWLTTLVFKYIMDNPSNLTFGDYILSSIRKNSAVNIRNFTRWAAKGDYNDNVGVLTSDWIYGKNYATEQVLELLYEHNNIPKNEIILPDTLAEGYYIRVTSSTIDLYNSYTYAKLRYDAEDDDILPNEPVAFVTGSDYPDSFKTEFREDTTTNTFYVDCYYLKGETWTLFKSFDETRRKRAFYSNEKVFLYFQYTLYHKTLVYEKYSVDYKEKEFIYTKGEGISELDALFTESSFTKESYTPYIPYRAWNHTLNPKDDEVIYKLGKKAHLKVFNKNSYQEIIDSIDENKDINKIDFAYCVFGISLNIPYQSARSYLWDYFKVINPKIYRLPFNPPSKYVHPILHTSPYNTGFKNYIHSKSTKYISCNLDIDITGNGIFIVEVDGKIKEDVSVGSIYVGTTLDHTFSKWRRRHEHTNNDFTWYTYTEHARWSINGDITVYEPDLKKKEMTSFIVKTGIDYSTPPDPEDPWPFNKRNIFDDDDDKKDPNNDYFRTFCLLKQTEENKYQVIFIYDLQYTNYIYKGGYNYGEDSVIYYAEDQIQEYPEDQKFSGFLVPIEYNTLTRGSISDSINCCQVCNNIVFNCYEVVKKKIKWYQTGIFKAFIVIVTIVIAVVITIFAPYASPGYNSAAAGWISVGTALGFTGTAALVAGFCVSVIGGIIVLKVLSPVLTDIFGPVIGQLLSFIASVIFTFGVGYLANTNITISTFLTNTLTDPSFYLGASSALAQGYANQIQLKLQALADRSNKLLEYYQGKYEELEEAYDKLLGSSSKVNNQLLSIYIAERPEEFFNRTMLTGSDIVDITQSMVYNFCDNSLKLTT